MLNNIRMVFAGLISFIVLVLAGTVAYMKQKKEEAEHVARVAKTKGEVAAAIRETEVLIQKSKAKARSDANDNRQMREERQAVDDRPELFGDNRLNQRMHNRRGDSDSSDTKL